MSEDGPKTEPAEARSQPTPIAEPSAAAGVDEAARAAERANPLEPTVSSAASEPAAAPEPVAPVNKLYEWGAAVVLMLLLSGVLFVFLSFFRGTGL